MILRWCIGTLGLVLLAGALWGAQLVLGRQIRGKLMEQAVLAYIKLSDEQFGSDQERSRLFALAEKLEEVIAQSGAGEFDGNEIGTGFHILFMYGPDADRLSEAVLPELRAFGAPAGSYVIRRYGEPGAREVRVAL